ncbi:MAG TPA: PAS domain-containing protein, partial [Byssovorax sp.]
MTPRERSLQAVNDALRVVARHADPLIGDAFQELASAIRAWVPFLHMGILTPEEPLTTGPFATPPGAPEVRRHKRLYAASATLAERIVPLGERVPTAPAADEAIYQRRERYLCDDGARGGDFERRAAAAGYGSYVSFPLAVSAAPALVVGELMFAFRAAGEAGAADLELLGEIAAALGDGAARVLSTARERRLAMILETSGDAMLAWDRDGRITDVNAAAAHLCQLEGEALIGAPVSSLLAPS